MEDEDVPTSLADILYLNQFLQRAFGQGLPDGGITVWIGAGTCERKASLELTVEDSGTEDAPIVYRAVKGENVYVTGRRAIDNFRPVTDPEDLSRLDEAARGKVLIADLKALGIHDTGKQNWSNRGGGPGLELFYQTTPMTLARWPNEGFVEIVDVTGPPGEGRYGTFSKVGKFIYEGDRPKRWAVLGRAVLGKGGVGDN